MGKEGNPIEGDIDLVKKIEKGDPEALRLFLDRFTPHMLFKVEEFIKGFCKNTAREYVCSLYFLKNSGHTQFSGDKRLQCGECIDSYLWFCDYFKKKARLYKGKSRLENYIWSILNSKPLFVDWIRWKYGRVDFQENRLPSSLKNLTEQEKQVFVLLRRRKTCDQISGELNISITEAEESARKIKEILAREGKLDMVCPVVVQSLFLNGSDGEEREIAIPAGGLEAAEKLVLKEFLIRLKHAINELPSEEKRVLSLRYGAHLTPNEILEMVKNGTIPLLKETPLSDLKLADVYSLIKSAMVQLLDILKEKARLKQEQFTVDLNGLKTILQEINI